ncbi:hypothetical protein Leryth_014217 [Lithospermum erythrorhizon]|nr:hypothetical protein Leryth_014217 [Lithospermum erythrorhizon]
MAEISPSKKKLDGKVAIITGGASGIGEASARLFATNGIRAIAIGDIQDELGKSVVESIGSNICSYFHCDVADEEQVKSMDRTFSINVRGMAACVKHEARAMVEGKIKGSIVCTASVTGSMGGQFSTDYFMSKHAVIGLMRCAWRVWD